MHTKDLNKDSGKTQGFLGGVFYPTHWYFFQTLWNKNMVWELGMTMSYFEQI